MNLDEIQAVIDSAKTRGTGTLEKYIGEKMPTASPQEVQDAVEIAVEIIETVPVFFATAAQEAEDRKITSSVQPVLERAARYFLHPVDILPEMTMGLVGLLDDTYLVLKILQVLEEGPEPFVEWDLDQPTTFIRRLLGESICRELDAISAIAFEDASGAPGQLWRTEPLDA